MVGGLLTIDTRKKTEFREEEITIARMLGTFIVLGMNSAVDAARQTRPETRKLKDQLRQQIAATLEESSVACR